MAVDASNFHLLNTIDTCSIWNVLSSTTFYNASQSAGCLFSCTRFVLYECLYKPKREQNGNETILLKRLKEQRIQGNLTDYHIDVEDLQEIEILQHRRNLSKGELSSIVLAKKTRQAFLTDDQSARILAQTILEPKMVQTTPHLFGWLFYRAFLLDSDKDQIIKEHCALGRPLAKYFEEMYLKALELKLSHS